MRHLSEFKRTYCECIDLGAMAIDVKMNDEAGWRLACKVGAKAGDHVRPSDFALGRIRRYEQHHPGKSRTLGSTFRCARISRTPAEEQSRRRGEGVHCARAVADTLQSGGSGTGG